MNVLNAIGRVGKDAVVRHTANGKAVTGWSLAVDRGFGDNKQTVWLDCSWWGDRGTKVAEHIKKGDRLGVTGEIGTREHDGKTYVTLDIRDVTLLGNKRDGESGGGARGRQSAPEQNAPGDGFDDDLPPF